MTALYCKIVVILGLALPMAEVISDQVPKGYYQLFYVYLFLGSLIFLFFIYVDLVRTRAQRRALENKIKTKVTNNYQGRRRSNREGSEEDAEDEADVRAARAIENDVAFFRPRVHYGSFYLRLGAVCEF